MNSQKTAWIAICVGVGAIFAGAFAEAMGVSHVIAVVFAGLGGVLGALIGGYVDRPKTNRQ